MLLKTYLVEGIIKYQHREEKRYLTSPKRPSPNAASINTEDWLYYTISYKGIKHPHILVFSGVLEPIPLWIQRNHCMWRPDFKCNQRSYKKKPKHSGRIPWLSLSPPLIITPLTSPPPNLLTPTVKLWILQRHSQFSDRFFWHIIFAWGLHCVWISLVQENGA